MNQRENFFFQLFLLGCFMLFFSAPPAIAQYRGFTEILPEEMTSEDIEFMKETAREKMQDQPIDTVITWKNPESGNSGAVKLLSRFQLEDRECMKNKHYILFQSGEKAVLEATVCRIEDGEWVFVS